MLSKMDDLELFELKQDISNEDSKFSDMINNEIKRRESEHKKFCATCGAELNGINQFTLLFGPEGLKKRASFCGIDCLEEFLGRLRESKYKEMKKETKEENKSIEIEHDNSS
jgi:hypothetical protein